MNDILSIIKSKNPEDITDEELNEFELLIEKAIQHVDKLQRIYKSLTGVDHVPPLRLD